MKDKEKETEEEQRAKRKIDHSLCTASNPTECNAYQVVHYVFCDTSQHPLVMSRNCNNINRYCLTYLAPPSLSSTYSGLQLTDS